MECDCSYDVDDYVEILSDNVVKARKQHICLECGEPIKPGDKYEDVNGIYEGEFVNYKTCLPCVAIRKRYCPNGWLYGGLREHITECIEMDYVTGEVWGDW